jgi:AAA15 family ATPase/GTPase
MDKHVADRNTEIPILRSAVIYGPNASGKSNLIKAMAFARNYILDNSRLAKSSNESFRMSNDGNQSPSVFTFQLKIDDQLYEYGFAISFKRLEVLEEWLVNIRKDVDNVDIFTREFDEEIHRHHIVFNTGEQNGNAKRYETYKEDLETASSDLVLSNLAVKKFGGDHFKEIVDAVYQWFVKLIVLFPDSTINLIGAMAKDKEAVNRLYKQYYNLFDIDIDEIQLIPISSGFIDIPKELMAQLKTDLTRDTDGNSCILHGGNRDYLVKLDENSELEFSEIKFLHKTDDGEVAFGIENESDGTMRLFDLIPVLGKILSEDRVLIVDEIDRSLHCILTRKMLEHFYKNSENRRSQLICTTHDVVLLDRSPITNQEIWFVDKKGKQSTLYPLSSYRLSGDKDDIIRKYLIGRFAAIPQ